jgi:hypothetical protein
LFTAMTGIFTPAYSVSKRTGSDGPRTYMLEYLAWIHRLSAVECGPRLVDGLVGEDVKAEAVGCRLPVRL